MLDRPMIVELVKLTLKHGMYATRTVATAAEAATALAAWQPHLVILDMDLDGPRIMGQIGTTVAGAARLSAIAVPRRGDLKGKLATFECGADDIVTIPFAPEELLARVLAVLRRSYGDAVTFVPVITLGDLDINILRRTVRAGTSELHLTSLDQSLLYLLAANRGAGGHARGDHRHAVGVHYVAESSVVDRQIRNLRERLHDDSRHPRFIATVTGRGYRFLPTFADGSHPAQLSPPPPLESC